MVSISFAEILTICLIALIVFGPRRLPGVMRRAGRLVRDLRSALAELRDGLEAGTDAEDRLDEVRRRLGTTSGEGDADDAGDER